MCSSLVEVRDTFFYSYRCLISWHTSVLLCILSGIPMSSLVIATSIPTNINTLETLIAWAGLTYAFTTPTLSVNESLNNPQKVAQAQIFQDATNAYRILVRASLPLDPTFVSDRSKKLWMFAQESSNVAIPAGYSAN